MTKRRTNEEWMNIIHQCKSSGYSDIEWCRQNNIPVSTFYNKLNKLRMQAAMIEPTKPVVHEKQEVIQVDLHACPSSSKAVMQSTGNTVALRLNINGFTIDILNGAEKITIENTLHSLRSLC